ncbi:sugar transferase [Psychroserpens burtonensis]|uniref:Sugar transferase n=2 Tax=Psychroserpens burtonensis TaxID=49278 RepID=A0A5C7BFG2_9FLAO|nr:sugar transferase [Psychroserpens burtonensis]
MVVKQFGHVLRDFLKDYKVITNSQLVLKRGFDVVLSCLVLPVVLFPILVLVLVASIDTQQFGLFSQDRIGQYGQVFKIFKLRTLKAGTHQLGHLKVSATRLGQFLRVSKIDELPQLFNVLIGNMSFVGPRPDVKGFADQLQGEDRMILKVKPGITGPATLKYKNEEALLSQQADPETYNRTIIWADKIEINKKYVQNWSFSLDLYFITKSIRN